MLLMHFQTHALLLLAAVQLPIILAEKVLSCQEPPEQSCVQLLVAKHRSRLEEARSRNSLQQELEVIGLGRRGIELAAKVLDSLPRFDDETGRPLNQAAEILLRDDDGTRRAGAGSAQKLDDVPSARIANGTWKYVLLEIEDSEGRRRTLVRNTAHLFLSLIHI